MKQVYSEFLEREGELMSITEAMIMEVGERLYTEALVDLPQDIIDRIIEMKDAEVSDIARLQLDNILTNIELAKDNHRPICQDTAISSYKVKIGTNAKIEGDIAKALSMGTALTTKNLPTIPHSVHPITRVNTGNGTGSRTPIIHYEVIPEADYIEIMGQPVGGGGDLCSAVKMFVGSASITEVKKFIIDTVAEAGCKPCPPMIVGIGLGNMFESVNGLAKEAVMRPLNKRHPEKLIADLEEELLTNINELGIGPMGMGGKTTALAVNIEYGNTGTYILPVAIKIHCWCLRRKIARIYNDGKIQYL